MPGFVGFVLVVISGEYMWNHLEGNFPGPKEGCEPTTATIEIEVAEDDFSVHSRHIFTPLRVGWPPTPQVYFGP